MIQIKNLYFSYNGTKPYNLENININLPKENYISIVGENGSCKTTLLKLILGYLKPQKGTIKKDFKSIGYVPQRLENFNSGGQQQRIFIARALIGSPDLLVLDELSTGIDEKTQLEVYSLIHELTKSKKLTVISVEHNKEKAIKYSSLILELKFANAHLYTTEEYLDYYNENLRKVN